MTSLRLAGDPRKACGALVLHGFSGTPYEIHPLAEGLQAQGYYVEAPLLTGHGAGVAALARSDEDDWLRSAERALLDLLDRLAPLTPIPKVAVVGLSMGGLLTLRLAHRWPDLVRSIVVLAAPLWFPAYQMAFIRHLAFTNLPVPKLLGSDVKVWRERFRNPSTRAMPLRAVRRLLDLMAEVRTLLPEIHQPALLAHGLHDRTAPPECLTEMAARIGTPPEHLSVLRFARSGHLLPLDRERDAVLSAVLSHLSRTEPTPGIK